MYFSVILTLYILYTIFLSVYSLEQNLESSNIPINKETEVPADDRRNNIFHNETSIGPQWRIVGGHDCNETFMVAVVSDEKASGYLCAGTLISKNFVLTSATCLSEGTNPRNWYALVGISHLKNKRYKMIQVAWYRKVSNYSGDCDADAALLFLSEEITPRAGEVSFIQIPTRSIPDDMSNVCASGLFSVVGWGHETSANPIHIALTTQLKCAAIPYLSNEKCKEKSRYFKPHLQMCLSDPKSERGTCFGDLGGPVFCNGIQYGIISHSVYCTNPQHPTLISRVDRQLEYINQIMDLYRSGSCSEFGSLLHFTICLITLVRIIFLN